MGKLYYIDKLREVHAIMAAIRAVYRSNVTHVTLERVFLTTLTPELANVLASLRVSDDSSERITKRLATVFAEEILQLRHEELRKLGERLTKGA